MNDKVHIRDLMIVSKQELKEKGTVPNVTLCGLNDPEMKELTFGSPEVVLHRKLPNCCDGCIRVWKNESESVSNYKKSYNDFRKILHKVIRGGYR